MLIANGAQGTIGKHLPKDTLSLGGDLATSEQLENFKSLKLEGSAFIHLAGVVGGPLVEKDVAYSERVNVEAVGEMGKTALACGLAKFVYVSSSHVYKSSSDSLTEESELGPISILPARIHRSNTESSSDSPVEN